MGCLFTCDNVVEMAQFVYCLFTTEDAVEPAWIVCLLLYVYL